MTDILASLTTEQRNVKTTALDRMTTMEILTVMNEEDEQVVKAVKGKLPNLARAVDAITASMKKGGRLFYVGAGTSGRLGIMDASECPPTFMISHDMVQAVMAGGDSAFTQARENSEDSLEQGKMDLKSRSITKGDVVIGITASGRTPYPIGALQYARELGAYTVSLSCNDHSEISHWADCPIEVVVGPEVLTGSTRLKAATAHKMMLNMISTSVMVQLGKVYENLMVDVHASNYKLRERAKRILMECTTAREDEAEAALKEAGYQVKPAIVMLKAHISFEKAKQLLDQHEGHLQLAIDSGDQDLKTI